MGEKRIIIEGTTIEEYAERHPQHAIDKKELLSDEATKSQ